MAYVTVCPHVALGVVERYGNGKCAQCQRNRSAARRAKNPERARAAARAWAKANPERKKARDKAWNEANYKRKLEQQRAYKGIIYAPGESFDVLFRQQGGLCANQRCRKDLSTLSGKHVHVDHDHAVPDAPNVRGILCGGCNTGIGKLGESAERALGAHEYLKAWEARIQRP